ncbi:PLP-dependent aminotransferase family protein [Actinocrispum wychmicini]|uniref:aminotransferase-like domain-containing protein n=1 Tax=Actinocrispum wychmicini TaxID=1213861 RepID=UPI00312C7A59
MDRKGRVAELADALGDWAAAPGPRYRTLADALASAIHTGLLGRGDRLPAERAFAGALALSRSTVVAAYDELRGRGLVTSRHGSGTTVAAAPGRGADQTDGRVAGGQATALLQRLVDRPPDIISLAYAVDDGTSELADELVDLARTDLPRLLRDAGYHPHGLPELRTAIAEYYCRSGLPTTPAQVLATTGATQAIGLATQLYLRRGAVVLVESPSWPGCLDIFRAAGARLVGVPLDEEGIQADVLASAITGTQPDLLFVMPAFHNPTGTLMSAARRRQVAALCDRHRVPVLEDISHIGHPTALPAPVAAHGTGAAETLTVGGLAKTIWGGLRVGWVRAPIEITDRLTRLKALADLGSPVLDQALAARLLPRVGELADRRHQLRRHRLAHATELLRTQLPSWRWRVPDGGPALWIELPGADARAFAAIAVRHGVEVVPGSTTDSGDEFDSFIRLPFTFPEEVFTEVISRLTRAWDELTRHGPMADPHGPIV